MTLITHNWVEHVSLFIISGTGILIDLVNTKTNSIIDYRSFFLPTKVRLSRDVTQKGGMPGLMGLYT